MSSCPRCSRRRTARSCAGCGRASAPACRSDCGSITRTGSPIPAATSTPGRPRPAAPTCWSRRSCSTASGFRRAGRRPARRATTPSPRSTACSSTPPGAPALEALDASLRPAGPLDWHGPHPRHPPRRRRRHPATRRCGVSRASSQRDRHRAEDAVAELLACFPVYRSYLPLGAEHLDAALASATARRPDLAESLAQTRSGARAIPAHPAAIRFQQTSGMVMAKGVEDNAFYRDTRLATLTEVGGEPDQFALTVDAFHDAAGRPARADSPHAMTTLTTHDTKRGEDTRARISVLAEVPGEWADFVRRRQPARRRRVREPALAEHRRQLAARSRGPARVRRSRRRARRAGGPGGRIPTSGFEAELLALVDTAFDDPETVADLEAIVERIAAPGWSNSLEREAAAADRSRRPRRLPGHRALGLLARRSGQPATGRLRDAAAASWPSSMQEPAARRRDRRRQAARRIPSPSCPPRPARAVHRLHAADRDRTRRGSSHRRRSWRRDRSGDAPADRARGRRRLARHRHRRPRAAGAATR